jgi:molecular chaperone GrpE (heat shock protein)
MTMTTHDAQMQRYSEPYRPPETAADTTNETEIALLLKEIAAAQQRIAESQADLERLTERNLGAIRDALSGTKQ